MALLVNPSAVRDDHKDCVWFLSAKCELYSSYPDELEHPAAPDPPLALVGKVGGTAQYANGPFGDYLLLVVQLPAPQNKRVVIAVNPEFLANGAPAGERFFLGKNNLRNLVDTHKPDELRGEFPSISIT